MKLLESEQEAASDENRRRTALSTENYDFALAGYENDAAGGRYILDLLPKTKNKFLYRGKIWVDANDFAVVRIEGEPGKNPSFWIKKTEIAHRYVKVNGFWLPAENHTESVTRLGGRAILSIEYKDYKITRSTPLPVENARADKGIIPHTWGFAESRSERDFETTASASGAGYSLCDMLLFSSEGNLCAIQY